MEYWLPVAWFGVIGFGVLMYVLLDGFVLGLGILAPFAEDERQLDHMMNTAAPIWGRLPRSRSPPQPKTQISRPPPARSRAARRTFSSESGVCA